MVIADRKPAPESAEKATGSIAHAAKILVCLSNDVHNVSDIARQCSFSKSTVHRVLKLLEQAQLVVQDTINRRYYLSLSVNRLAEAALNTHKRLITYAGAEMQRLASVSEETVALDIMSGLQYYSLLGIPSQHSLRVTRGGHGFTDSYSGDYSGASVKVLLSQVDDARLNMLMDIMKFNPPAGRPAPNRETLLAQIREIRQRGYAISRGERVPGTICIAAPIRNYILPVGLSVLGPDTRLQSRLKEVLAELRASVGRISRNIDGRFGKPIKF